MKIWPEYFGIAIAAILVGYLLGGWVSETTDAGLWSAIKEWQTLIAGLIAVGAAAAAYQAVRWQVSASDRQRHEDRLIADAATSDEMTVLLTVLILELENDKRDPRLAPENLAAIGALRGPAMLVDARLGSTVQAFLSELSLAERKAREVGWGEIKRQRRMLAFRCAVLAEAFSECRRAMSLNIDPEHPFVGAERLGELFVEYSATAKDLIWAGWLTEMGASFSGTRIAPRRR